MSSIVLDRRLRRFLIALAALSTSSGLAAVHASAARPAAHPVQPRLVSLAVLPKAVMLRGPYAEARVLIDGREAGGRVRDVSGAAALSLADPSVAAADESGTVRGRRDGKTVLIARLGGLETRVPVEVQGFRQGGPPRFLTDVLPVLTRAGCNQGACHGAAAGKGGFRLSLFGYDPQFDYDSLTRLGGARRITRAQAERSLILRKPSLQVAHGGGKRFEVGSPAYRLLRDWIRGGVPAPADTEPQVVRLEVIPAVRTLAVGRSQRFVVKAHYSDGSQRDTTAQTLFSASDETVASVTPEGEAKATGPGEGAVVIRYRGLVTTARVVSPFGPPLANPAAVRSAGLPTGVLPPADTASHVLSVRSWRGNTGRETGATHAPAVSPPQPEDTIDALVFAKLGALGLTPSRPCTDTEFIRRAFLDAIGLPPTPDEVRAFLWSRDPQKREKLIDALLERPEYVDFWTMKWGDLLRNSRRSLAEKGMYTFYRWIRQSVAENKPWDEMSRELLVARGSGFRNGPANYFRSARTPEDLAESTTAIFLGVRVQCARCHNHPFEKWTQNDYYHMAAFFARVKLKPGDTQDEQDVYLTATGEEKHPRTGQEMRPAALDAAPLPADFHGDRREALARWLTSPENPYFSHAIVNRVWRHFLGRGLVEPVDDLRATNPPSNTALFDWLARDLAQHGYDLKHLMRSIMRSQTYQLSAHPTKGNERDGTYYSHYLVRRLGAEPLLDVITCATGVAEKFSGYPLGTRATQLPDNGVPSYFLDVFGRPPRMVTCECERTNDPNTAQALHLMNGAGINEKLSAKNGRISALLQADRSPGQIVDDLYLGALARFPTTEESRRAVQTLAAPATRRQAAEDLLWALLNTKEFVFNH